MSGSPSKNQSTRKRKRGVDSNDADQEDSIKHVRKDVSPKPAETLDSKPLQRTKKPKIKKPRTDKREYHYYQLPNQLRVLLVSDKTCQKANVHLMVKCGRMMDPVNLLGLAHYVEHMVSANKRNKLHFLLSKHGGSFDAHALAERTNYSFTVLSDWLSPAMQEFSDAIVCPKFMRDLLRKEVNSIDTEFQQLHEYDCISHLLAVLSKDYPSQRGFAGNKKSLFTTPQENGIDVYNELKSHYNKHYIPSNMCLVVIGKEPIKKLKHIVFKSHFKDTVIVKPNTHNNPPSAGSEDQFSYAKCKVYIKCLFPEQYSRLIIQWSVDKFSRYYPVKYINTLMEHYGPTGLRAILMQKGFAHAINARFHDIRTNNTVYIVELTLTGEGIYQFEDVVGIIYSYIKFLKGKKSHDDLYKHCKHMAKKDLVDKQNQEDYAAVLCGRLWDVWIHNFPAADILQDYTFPPEGADISHFLGQLKPDNCRIIFMGSVISLFEYQPASADYTKDDLYPMSYYIRPIDNALIQQWKDVAIDPYMQLPDVSGCYTAKIAKKSTQSARTEESSSGPKVVAVTSLYTVWYTQDSDLLPEFASFRLRVTPPAESTMWTDTNKQSHEKFFWYWQHYLYLYNFTFKADLGGLTCILEDKHYYFTVHVEGYPEQVKTHVINVMHVLDMMLAKELRGQTDEERAFYNWVMTLIYYVHKLEFLVCGHISKVDAIKLCETVSESFDSKKFSNVRRPTPNYINSKETTTSTSDSDELIDCEELSTTSSASDSTSCVKDDDDVENEQPVHTSPVSSPISTPVYRRTPWLQPNLDVFAVFDCTAACVEFGQAIVDLFGQVMYWECFNYLRTGCQLAYVVAMYTEHKEKLIINVKSFENHFKVQSEIEIFLMDIVPERLNDLTPKKLKIHKATLEQTHTLEPINQRVAHNWHWNVLQSILDQDGDAEKNLAKLKENLENYILDLRRIRLTDLNRFYQKYIHPKGSFNYEITGNFFTDAPDDSTYKQAYASYQAIFR